MPSVPPIDNDVEGTHYAALLYRASETARKILSQPNLKSLKGRARFIHDRSVELATIATHSVIDQIEHDSIAVEALKMLETHWTDVVSGMTGEQLLRMYPDFWDQLMTDWPMGVYASIAADYLKKLEFDPDATVIEIGSGVGAVIRKSPDLQLGNYTRSDLNPFVLPRNLPGRIARYDFNKPGLWTNVDCIFGVNALHCADDPISTLSYLFHMLRPRGRLVIVEGENPTSEAGTPWALNHVFGLFDGWWNIGGFRRLSDWRDDLERVGFTEVRMQPYCAGAHHLGGLVSGVVPGRGEGERSGLK